MAMPEIAVSASCEKSACQAAEVAEEGARHGHGSFDWIGCGCSSNGSVVEDVRVPLLGRHRGARIVL